MSKPMTPELKKFMDKRISVKLNAHRLVMGRLRGFDHFMNMVLDEAIEEVSATEKREIGLIVREKLRAAIAGRDAVCFPLCAIMHPFATVAHFDVLAFAYFRPCGCPSAINWTAPPRP